MYTLYLNNRKTWTIGCIDFINTKYNKTYFSNDINGSYSSNNLICENKYISNLNNNNMYFPIYESADCFYKNETKLKHIGKNNENITIDCFNIN